MINAKKLIMLAMCTFCFSVLSKAQAEKEEEQIHIPESYQEAQKQIENDESVGTATYNIDESTAETEQSAASWSDEYSEEEELRVYSGSHDGNNFVKTIKVKKAVDRDAGYKPGQEYQPH